MGVFHGRRERLEVARASVEGATHGSLRPRVGVRSTNIRDNTGIFGDRDRVDMSSISHVDRLGERENHGRQVRSTVMYRVRRRKRKL